MMRAMSVDEFELESWSPEPSAAVDVRVISAVHGAYHAVTKRLQRSIRPHGLDASEALALVAILRNPRCPPSDVRRVLAFHRSTLSSLLDRLEHDELIHRAVSPYDGRRYEIALTELGMISAEVADIVVGDLEAEIATYTSRGERRGAIAVFEACVAIDAPGRALPT
jgi:DNA-binding MarR family transcriptional regulator